MRDIRFAILFSLVQMLAVFAQTTLLGEGSSQLEEFSAQSESVSIRISLPKEAIAWEKYKIRLELSNTGKEALLLWGEPGLGGYYIAIRDEKGYFVPKTREGKWIFCSNIPARGECIVPLRLEIGKSIIKEVILSDYFVLYKPGNYFLGVGWRQADGWYGDYHGPEIVLKGIPMPISTIGDVAKVPQSAKDVGVQRLTAEESIKAKHIMEEFLLRNGFKGGCFGYNFAYGRNIPLYEFREIFGFEPKPKNMVPGGGEKVHRGRYEVHIEGDPTRSFDICGPRPDLMGEKSLLDVDIVLDCGPPPEFR